MQGTGGWVSPPTELAVRGEMTFEDDGNLSQGWAYNVWNITNSEAAVYTFNLDGKTFCFVLTKFQTITSTSVLTKRR